MGDEFDGQFEQLSYTLYAPDTPFFFITDPEGSVVPKTWPAIGLYIALNSTPHKQDDWKLFQWDALKKIIKQEKNK